MFNGKSLSGTTRLAGGFLDTGEKYAPPKVSNFWGAYHADQALFKIQFSGESAKIIAICKKCIIHIPFDRSFTIEPRQSIAVTVC